MSAQTAVRRRLRPWVIIAIFGLIGPLVKFGLLLGPWALSAGNPLEWIAITTIAAIEVFPIGTLMAAAVGAVAVISLRSRGEIALGDVLLACFAVGVAQAAWIAIFRSTIPFQTFIDQTGINAGSNATAGIACWLVLRWFERRANT